MIKLKITTHDKEEFEVSVEEYDAQELNEQFNNKELTTVCVGDVVLSRINVKSISPIAEEDTESAE